MFQGGSSVSSLLPPCFSYSSHRLPLTSWIEGVDCDHLRRALIMPPSVPNLRCFLRRGQLGHNVGDDAFDRSDQDPWKRYQRSRAHCWNSTTKRCAARPGLQDPEFVTISSIYRDFVSSPAQADRGGSRSYRFETPLYRRNLWFSDLHNSAPKSDLTLFFFRYEAPIVVSLNARPQKIRYQLVSLFTS